VLARANAEGLKGQYVLQDSAWGSVMAMRCSKRGDGLQAQFVEIQAIDHVAGEDV
jgi:hypothetical protein